MFSVISGQFLARVGRYMPLVITGFGLWTVGTGLKCMFGRSTHIGTIVGILLIEGAGVGFTLQPTLIGLLANSRDEDRAVCTGLRNFARTVGGAFGLISKSMAFPTRVSRVSRTKQVKRITVSGAILSNTLRSKLSPLPFITPGIISGLTSSAYSLDSLGLTDDEKSQILDVYMTGLHYIYIFYCASTAVNFVMSFGVGNTRTYAKKSKEEATATSASDEEPAAAQTSPGAESGAVDEEKATR